jgi:hypothetical protein
MSHHGKGLGVPDQPNGARGKPLVRATIAINAPLRRYWPRPGNAPGQLRPLRSAAAIASMRTSFSINREWSIPVEQRA